MRQPSNPVAWAVRETGAKVWKFTDETEVARRSLTHHFCVIPLFFDRELTRLSNEALQSFCSDVKASGIHSRASVARGIALRAKEIVK